MSYLLIETAIGGEREVNGSSVSSSSSDSSGDGTDAEARGSVCDEETWSGYATSFGAVSASASASASRADDLLSGSLSGPALRRKSKKGSSAFEKRTPFS